jgi:CRP/FNR family transcriptional regulator, cyclic AMP receptor protein
MDKSFLKKVVLFKDLNTEELEIFARKLRELNVKKGNTIIKEDEESDKLFILYKGDVSISKKITMVSEEEQINKTFMTLSASDHQFFGEIGLLGFLKGTANVLARTDCTLYTINQKSFLEICELHPGIGFKILLEISRKLSKLLEKMNDDILKLTTALIYALK